MGNYIPENKGQNDALSTPFPLTNNVRPFPSTLRTKKEAQGGLFAKTRQASLIEPRPVEWLWPGWIPKDCVGALTGDPKAGKSTFLRAFVAALTTGKPFPGQTAVREPINVWWLTAEEDAGRHVVPSLILHGADLARVFIQDDRVDLGTAAARAAFRRYIREKEIGFVVIDSLSSWVENVDLNSPSAGAGWVQGFKEIAAEEGCTVLIVRHRRKGAGKGPDSEAAMGSQTIQAVLRFELMIKVDGEVRTLARSAGNLGREPESLGATLEGEGDNPVWVWGGPVQAAVRGGKLSKAQSRTLGLIPADGMREEELFQLFLDAKVSKAEGGNARKIFRAILKGLGEKGLITGSADGLLQRYQ